MKRVVIHSDGSCSPNPGPGGWGAVLSFEDGTELEIGGKSDGATTNNRMEITAVIEALRRLDRPHIVTVITDSRYVQGGGARCAYCLKDRETWTYGATAEPWKLNRDLWYKLMETMKPHQIHWKWVRGHGSCAGNNRADALATCSSKACLDKLPDAI